MTKRKYTHKDRVKIASMYARGIPIKKIAHELGRTAHAIKMQLYIMERKKLKTETRTEPATVTTELVTAVVNSNLSHTHKVLLLSRLV